MSDVHRPVDTVVFDVDGTLVDSERDGHRVAFNLAFEEFGLSDHWDVETYGELLTVAGGARRLAHWFRAHGVPADVAREQAGRAHRRKTELMADLVTTGRITARPGVIELIDWLRDRGADVHVATTGTRAWVAPLLDRLFRGRFGTVVTGTEVTRLKPDPAAYLEVVRIAGACADRTVAVEDSANGLQAARNAGLRCVVSRNPYTRADDFTGASLVVDDLSDPAVRAWFDRRIAR